MDAPAFLGTPAELSATTAVNSLNAPRQLKNHPALFARDASVARRSTRAENSRYRLFFVWMDPAKVVAPFSLGLLIMANAIHAVRLFLVAISRES